MKKIKDLTYFMEAPMHAFPRYSAILLALALSLPAAFAQEVEDIDIAIEEETPVADDAEAIADDAEAVADGAEAVADDAEAVADDAEAQAQKELLREQTNAFFEEVIDRQKQERNADELQRKASSAFEHEDYDVAVDAYVDVLKLLEDDVVNGEVSDANKRKIAEVKNMISQSYYYWARKIFNEAEKTAQIGLYDEAIEKCEKAIEVYPLSEPIMRKAIDEYTIMKASAQYKEDTSEKELLPNAKDREKRISLLIRQGQTLYNTKQWNKAQEKFNQVIILDPYNITAIDYLRRIYIHESEVGDRRRGAVVLERAAEAMWEMIAPISIGSETSDDTVREEIKLKEDNAGNTQQKLNKISIDHIDFEEVSIAQVVQFLKHTSKDKDEDHVGVNFVLRFNTDETESSSSSSYSDDEDELDIDDDMEEENTSDEDDDSNSGFYDYEDNPRGSDGGGSGSVQTAENTTVTLAVDNVTLEDAIRFICKSANLQYRVENYAVVIAAKDVPLDEYIRKTYPIDKEILASSIIGGDLSNDNVKQYLVDRGIPFPTGTSVRYDEMSSRLTVYNTAEALDKVEDLIDQMDVSDPQVLIQVKFVEIELNDLQELSFDYTFSRIAPTWDEVTASGLNELSATGNDGAIADHSFIMYYQNGSETRNSSLANAWVTPAITSLNTKEMQSLNVEKGDTYYVPGNLEAGEAYYAGVLQSEAAKNYGHHLTWGPNSHFNRNAQTSAGIFGATTSMQNDAIFNWSTYNADGYQFAGGIHALDNADSTEILSAPRLTTMNNQNAVIRMITEKYYPTDWDEAELETISSNGSNVPVFTPSIPQFGGATEEGIALQVRPRVEEDNYTIFLEMTPVIQEFIGWTDYSYSIPLGDNGELYPNTLKMPIIEARYLNTNVMSYDGETVVLGGVIRDELSMIEDQYPILGDLPLIGRFFQGKGKGAKKTNLLVFLTSRLIKPDGSPFREDQSGRGVPAI